MIAESALCLLDSSRPKLPPLGLEGGVLTPVTAFGDALVERLQKSERFELSSRVVEGGEA